MQINLYFVPNPIIQKHTTSIRQRERNRCYENGMNEGHLRRSCDHDVYSPVHTVYETPSDELCQRPEEELTTTRTSACGHRGNVNSSVSCCLQNLPNIERSRNRYYFYFILFREVAPNSAPPAPRTARACTHWRYCNRRLPVQRSDRRIILRLEIEYPIGEHYLSVGL